MPTEAIRMEQNLYKNAKRVKADVSMVESDMRKPGSRMTGDPVDSAYGTQRTSHREFTIRK